MYKVNFLENKESLLHFKTHLLRLLVMVFYLSKVY